MIFGTRFNKASQNNLLIKIDNTILERVEKTKFLGVIVNIRLSWTDQ